MKRYFKILLICFLLNSCIGTTPTVQKLDYLTSSNTSITSNNQQAQTLLVKYTDFQIGVKTTEFQFILVDNGSNEFTINKTGGTITITGNTLQGVVYFLDKYAGVRFYMPTELWTSKIKDSILIDTAISISHIPYTPVIFSTGYKSNDESYWALYNNLSNNSFGVTQHTMSIRFYDSAMFKLFPDVYGNGYPKSAQDQNFEPDFTKLQCVTASMYSARKFFTANPNQKYISFSVMDSKLGYPTPIQGQTLSQSFTNYINSLADSFKIVFPDKKIDYLIYGSVNDFPAPYRLKDNVIPITVIKPANAIIDGLTDTANSKLIGQLMPNLGNHDWAEGYGFLVPRIYSVLLQKVFNVLNYAGIKLQFAHLEMYPNWSLDGMKYYEMAKLYDDPTIKIDSVRTLFCNDMFGTGATAMKSYFDNLERLSTSMNNNPLISRSLGYYPSQMELTVQDSTLAANARGYINQALKLTTGIENQRVQFFSNGFRISEGLWCIHNQKPGDAYINDYINFVTDSISGNQMYLNIATNTDFIKNTINQIK